MNIALIGPRCSGKTTVGQRLADKLWWQFVDTDVLIQENAGKTIAEISEDGANWPAFRKLEKETIAEVAARDEHVIACGGGVPLDPDNVAALKAGSRVIWLQCDAETIYQRMNADALTAGQRPNLTDKGGLEEIQQVLAAREAIYEAAADSKLDTTHMSIDEVVYHLARLNL